LQVDPFGFRQRCQRRIELGRTWLIVGRDQLVFKADVVSETPEVTYLEGVYVHPDYRRRGNGSRLLAQLTRKLFARTKSISVLVNQDRPEAQEFFRKLGFMSRGYYDTHFLRTQSELS
jgi:predicted GNAT family acetyltransferase